MFAVIKTGGKQYRVAQNDVIVIEKLPLEAGADVDGYHVGDDVMGAFRFGGADAEYAVVRPSDRYTAVARKPASLSYAEAGALPFAGLVALAGGLHGLRVRLVPVEQRLREGGQAEEPVALIT